MNRTLVAIAVVGAVAAVTLGFVPQTRAQGEQVLVVGVHGGAYEDVQRKVFFEPFTKETGIKIIGVPYPNIAKVKSIQVGETRLLRLQVGIMDLSIVSKALETELDGVIGFNFLRKFRVIIDYPKKTVTFE